MSVEALRWAKTQRPNNATQRAVLMAVAEYANESGLGWPSQRTLAADMLLTDRTIRTALAGLEADGLIMRFSKRNKDGTRGVDKIQLTMTPELRSQAESRSQRKNVPVAQPAENNSKTTGNNFQNHRKTAAKPPEAVSGQEPSLGKPPVGIPHKPNQTDATASGLTAGLSAKDRLWFEGRPILIEAGLSERTAGSMIGQWLSRYKNPDRILSALLAVRDEGSRDPIPFVVAILDAEIGKRPGRSPGKRSAMLSIGLKEGGWVQ